jgi:hypothetical protein
MAIACYGVDIPPMFLLLVFIAEPPVPPIAALITFNCPSRGNIITFPIYTTAHEGSGDTVAVELVHHGAVADFRLVAVVGPHRNVNPFALRIKLFLL